MFTFSEGEVLCLYMQQSNLLVSHSVVRFAQHRFYSRSWKVSLALRRKQTYQSVNIPIMSCPDLGTWNIQEPIKRFGD